MASLTLVAFGGAFILGGILAIKGGVTLRKQANLIEETPTEDVGSVSTGQSAIEGAARPVDEGTIRAPFTDEACLVARWEVEEFTVRENSRQGTTRKWRTRGAGLDAVPFAVDDGTGQALVLPPERAEYEIDTATEEPIVVPDGGEPPELVRRFLERDGWEGINAEGQEWGNRGGDTGEFDDGDRRFSQDLITPGEDVYVFGVAQSREDRRAADDAGSVVFQKVPETDADREDMFMISDLSAEEIVENRSGAMWYLPLGVVLVTVGLGIVLWGSGLF